MRSIVGAVTRAVGAAIKAVTNIVMRAGKAGLRAGVRAARVAGRVVMAGARVAGRAAYVGAGLVASAANNILGLLGRGGGTELPEPEVEVSEPGAEFSEYLEEAHLEHELGEVEGRLYDDPNAQVYKFLVSDDRYRRNTKLDGVKPEIAGWAYRLPAAERLLVKRAGAENLLKHLAGTKMIKGVPAVRPRENVIDFTQRSDTTYALADDLGPGTEMRLAL